MVYSFYLYIHFEIRKVSCFFGGRRAYPSQLIGGQGLRHQERLPDSGSDSGARASAREPVCCGTIAGAGRGQAIATGQWSPAFVRECGFDLLAYLLCVGERIDTCAATRKALVCPAFRVISATCR